MKLTPALLILAAFSPALAQTTTPTKPAAKPVVRHTTTKPATKTDTACDAGLVLPGAAPKVAGCTKPLYELRYIDTVVGTGDVVTPRKWLTVAYTGYLLDGTKFDSSVGKDPITFPYGAHQVITGWDTGFEGMHVGGKRRLYIPYELAYGEGGRPPVIPQKAELVFDLQLIGISENPPAPKTPPTPPAPPAGTAKPASEAPASTGAQPSAQQTVGKPTATPAPDPAKPTAPTDPTKPAAVPPKQ